MTRDKICNLYFEWLSKFVDEGKTPRTSYRKILMFLHSAEFRYTISNDSNRAEDGMKLRDRFVAEKGYENLIGYLEGPCSVLEMMVALAIRCEVHIMDDSEYGDRTRQWFWGMMVNMGLGNMTDDNFDKGLAYEKVNNMLDRNYSTDGKGGLFRVKNCRLDMRAVEIWYQANWYFSTIV